MQGITVALSFEGVKQLVGGICAPASYLEKAINNTPLNDYSITDDSLGEAWIQKPGGSNAEDCTKIHVYLTQGAISSYTMSSSGLTIQQQKDGAFLLSFSSGAAFNANYTWHENWFQQDEYYEDNSDGDGNWVPQGSPYEQSAGPFNFSLGVGSLDTTATFTFAYDSNSNTWLLPVSSVTTSPSNPTPNIPGGSVLQHSTTQCNAQIHLEQGAIDSLDKGDDFHAALTNGVFNHPLASIPATGQLTPDITFLFGLGDPKSLTFPGDQGLTVGVTGISTYQEKQYSPADTPPPDLPVPAVPKDGHHLCMYVSNYVLNGLFWAYQQAGLLDGTFGPDDFPSDPDLLKVTAVIVALAPDFNKYLNYSMQAQIHQLAPPTVTFQVIYAFTQTVMNDLQDPNNPNHLPANVYQDLEPILNQAFLTKADLETYLSTQLQPPVPSQYYPQIEAASLQTGAVVTHDIQFTVTIPLAPPISGNPSCPIENNAPGLILSVSRVDFLPEEGLALGVTNNAQTLQFEFTNISYTPTYKCSNFLTQGNDPLTEYLWAGIGEPKYKEVLSKMGQDGAPLPIMQGFQFLFEQSKLTIESDFISILSNVEFKG